MKKSTIIAVLSTGLLLSVGGILAWQVNVNNALNESLNKKTVATTQVSTSQTNAVKSAEKVIADLKANGGKTADGKVIALKAEQNTPITTQKTDTNKQTEINATFQNETETATKITVQNMVDKSINPNAKG
jgi:predicted negative regulator of RcsB-dependent stress response